MCRTRWCNTFIDENNLTETEVRALRKPGEKGVGCTDCSGCAMERGETDMRVT